MSDYDVYIDSAPVDIEVTGAQGPSLGGGASDVGDLTTTGLTAGNLLRVAAAGGLEQRTPSQVRSDIGAAASSHSHTSSDISDAVSTATSNVIAKRGSSGECAFTSVTVGGVYTATYGSSAPLTANRSHYTPDATGTIALTGDSTGRPNALHNSTISGTVAFSGGADATFRTALGGTTVGQSLFTLTNPSAITFPRFNADNSVSALSASAFRTTVGAAASGANTDITGITSSTALTLASASGQNVTLNPGASGSVLASSSSFPVLGLTRTTTATGGTVGDNSAGVASGFVLTTQTSGDMTNGFGGGFLFYLADNAYSGVTTNAQARIMAQRDGADTDAAIGFWTSSSVGSAKMLVRANGNVLIGTNTDPSLGKLHVAGRISSTAGIRATPVTVGTLPTASTVTYDVYAVTDSLTPTVGSSVSAGGSAKALVCSNGTNWIVIATL